MNLTYRGTLGAAEVSDLFVFTSPDAFGLNFQGDNDAPELAVRVLPVDRDAVFTMWKLHAGTATSIGTITLHTSGAVTYSGSATSFAAGDAVYASGPPTSDSAMSDVGLGFDVGGPPAVTFTTVYSTGQLSLTLSRASLVDVDPTRYTITQPAGLPAVSVTGVSTSGTGAAVLQLSGDVRLGGAYSVTLAAGAVRAINDGGGNITTPVDFSITAVPFKLLSVNPLPPYPSQNLQVQFTSPATQVSSGGVHDCLNPSNYSITWSGGSLTISSVVAVSPDTVLLNTTADIPGVPYTLTPNPNLQSATGVPIS